MALIEITNDAYTVLIDDNYSNACLAQKSQLLLSSGTDLVDCYQVVLNYTTSEVPHLALELNDIVIGAVFTMRSGNTWSWYIFFRKAYVNRTINYYIFTVPSQVANANGLVQLFDGTGKIVFDSNLNYMMVKGFYQGPAGNAAIGSDLVSGRTYAAIAVQPFVMRTHIMSPPAQASPPYNFLDVNAVGMFARSGNSIIAPTGVTQSGNNLSDNPGNQNYSSGNPRVLVVDVTGF